VEQAEAIMTGLESRASASLLPHRPLGSPPFTGAARVAFHIDEAIGLSPRRKEERREVTYA
jgi:hypothetical protein